MYPPDTKEQRRIAHDIFKGLAKSSKLRRQADEISDALPTKLGK